jgi:dTDP-glucose pyrophosphorylase
MESIENWQKTVILPSSSVLSAIQAINTSVIQIALVVNEQEQLIGTVTDGDIRRAILKGVSLDTPITSVMNSQPTVAMPSMPREKILEIMKHKKLRQIPIVDELGKVIGLALFETLLKVTKKDNWVVLMAGGLGSRLAPLTNDCPKPLLKVGGKPILENILEHFLEYGFHHFFVSVNYKSEMIEAYFGNGSKWGVEIQYLREQTRLGTAGGLKLLPHKPELPIFVMNSDLLTKINFLDMLALHQEQQSMATMAVREYELQVPFGVVQTDHQRITEITEKPLYKFNVNAGIYILEPFCLDLIPDQKFYDMPSLFTSLVQQQQTVVPFLTWEYWLDIGRSDDLERANGEYGEVFT